MCAGGAMAAAAAAGEHPRMRARAPRPDGDGGGGAASDMWKKGGQERETKKEDARARRGTSKGQRQREGGGETKGSALRRRALWGRPNVCVQSASSRAGRGKKDRDGVGKGAASRNCQRWFGSVLCCIGSVIVVLYEIERSGARPCWPPMQKARRRPAWARGCRSAGQQSAAVGGQAGDREGVLAQRPGG